MENTSNLILSTPKQKYVCGWFSFFLFVVGFGSLFGLISYLCVSRQVENLFPKEERIVFKRDKYFTVSLLMIPALLLLIYFIS